MRFLPPKPLNSKGFEVLLRAFLLQIYTLFWDNVIMRDFEMSDGIIFSVSCAEFKSVCSILFVETVGIPSKCHTL